MGNGKCIAIGVLMICVSLWVYRATAATHVSVSDIIAPLILQYNLRFVVLRIECRGCAMPESVTTATHIVTLNSSGFRGTLHGKYDLVIIDVHARKEL
jgi:hypothetical protein